jgi:hypothetical protein
MLVCVHAMLSRACRAGQLLVCDEFGLRLQISEQGTSPILYAHQIDHLIPYIISRSLFFSVMVCLIHTGRG